MSEPFSYEGEELELFAQAIHWKNYFRKFLSPYIRGDVLEVGAGIGTTTLHLHHHGQHWTCLEPDTGLAQRCQKNLQHLQPPVSVIVGTLDQLDEKDLFDCILYVDVLEHIRDDRYEIQLAADHLKPKGTLAILAPAHAFLFSPFDAAIGHFCRYNKASLRALAPPKLELHHLFYLDSAGMLASLANKCFLKSKMPAPKQVYFWDHVLVPVSKILDRLFCYRVGKSVLGIWEKCL